MYKLSKLRPYNVLEFEFPFCKHELCLVPSPPPAGCDSVSAILCSAVAAAATSSRHQGLPLLYLDLSDCPRVSDAGLQVIARNAPRLQHLYLRKCVGITGKWREPLLQNVKKGSASRYLRNVPRLPFQSARAGSIQIHF